MKARPTDLSGEGEFKRVGFAIIFVRGAYWAKPLASRGGRLYAEMKSREGTYYIRLLPNGDTTKKDIRWDEIMGVDAQVNGASLELVE